MQAIKNSHNNTLNEIDSTENSENFESEVLDLDMEEIE